MKPTLHLTTGAGARNEDLPRAVPTFCLLSRRPGAFGYDLALHVAGSEAVREAVAALWQEHVRAHPEAARAVSGGDVYCDVPMMLRSYAFLRTVCSDAAITFLASQDAALPAVRALLNA